MQDGFYAVFTNARKATVNGRPAYVADHALLGVRLGRLQFFFNPQADQVGGDMPTANPGQRLYQLPHFLRPEITVLASAHDTGGCEQCLLSLG